MYVSYELLLHELADFKPQGTIWEVEEDALFSVTINSVSLHFHYSPQKKS